MHLYHTTSPQSLHCQQLFHLIHEYNSLQTPTINAEALGKFLTGTDLKYKQDLIKFMHSIDKYNRQMREEYWGYCLSRALSSHPLESEGDLGRFRIVLRQFLTGGYVDNQEGYELWDGSNIKTPAQKDQAFARIIVICGELSLFISKIDFIGFSNNIQNINMCFSLINLFPQKSNQILQIYQNILNGTFLDTLQLALSMSLPQHLLIEAIKSLCYLYQGMKIQKISKLLQKSFLVNQQTLKQLIGSVKDTRPQIRYYTCVMMCLIVNNVKDQTNKKIFGLSMLRDLQLLKEISNGIAKIGQHEGLSFALQFFIGVIKAFESLKEQQKKQRLSLLNVYLNFAVDKLSQLKQPSNQAICIKLVAQSAKIIDFDESNLKLLKIANNVFEAVNKPQFYPLFSMTLMIVKNCLMYNRINIQQSILTDKSFQSYIKRTLSSGHEQWQPFYSALQIILMIASSPKLDLLFKRDLIPTIFQLGLSKSGIVRLYVSEILFYIVANSLDSEWKVTYLYEKNCMRVIGNLVAAYCNKDQILQAQFLTNYPLSYCCRRTLVNSLKTLYLITQQFGSLSMTKKKEYYIKNFSFNFINQINEGLAGLFRLINNTEYLTYILKQEHQIKRNISQVQIKSKTMIKLYKLISSVIQQMTKNLRKRDVDLNIMRQVNRTRNQIYTNFYTVLNYNDLLVENIPVYLLYSANIDGNTVNQRVYRLSWIQFRALVYEFIKRAVSIQAESFIIIDKYSGSQVHNEDSYRVMMDKIVLQYKKYKYIVDLKIQSIKQRQVQPKTLNLNIGTQSMRGSPQHDYDRRRFMSYRMPQVRDNSPFNYSNSRRGFEGSPGRNTRNISPNFGGVCRECGRPTHNRSERCNNCINNY